MSTKQKKLVSSIKKILIEHLYEIDYGDDSLVPSNRDKREEREDSFFDKEEQFLREINQTIKNLYHKNQLMMKECERMIDISPRHKPRRYNFYLELSDQLQKLKQLIEKNSLY